MLADFVTSISRESPASQVEPQQTAPGLSAHHQENDVDAEIEAAGSGPWHEENAFPVSRPALWPKIRDFTFDADDELPFSARLARENGWSPEKTSLAIEEYRRFLYLVCVSPSPVTPSEVVDQVWHLHLLYTRSYWLMLCGVVLGRQIHHEPTRGGAREREKFHRQYHDTLELYRAEYGSEPPARAWPSLETRPASSAARAGGRDARRGRASQDRTLCLGAHDRRRLLSDRHVSASEIRDFQTCPFAACRRGWPGLRPAMTV